MFKALPSGWRLPRSVPLRRAVPPGDARATATAQLILDVVRTGLNRCRARCHSRHRRDFAHGICLNCYSRRHRGHTRVIGTQVRGYTGGRRERR